MQQQDNHEYPFLYQRQTCHQVQPNQATYQKRQKCQPATYLRSEERFSRNAETDLVCRLLLEKKKKKKWDFLNQTDLHDFRGDRARIQPETMAHLSAQQELAQGAHDLD